MSDTSPPAKPSAPCTAIVVNYNAGEILAETIGDLLQAGGVASIRLVDNASSDNSLDRVKQQHAEAMLTGRLRILQQPHNRGFSAACNAGAKGVDTPYLAFVNPDCRVCPDTLSMLVESLQSHPEAALAGAWVCNPDGSEQRATRRRLPTPWRVFRTISGLEKPARRWPRFFSWLAGVNLDFGPKPEAITEVEAVNGALMMVRRHDFDAVGGFDEGFPLHFEDLDLFARLQQQGKKILLVPAACAVHHQGSCSADSQLIKRLKRHGLRRYWHKHSRNPVLKAVIRLIPKANLLGKL